MIKNIAAASVLVFLAACATTGKIAQEPGWVMRGSGALNEAGKAFYGVGLAAASIGDESLRRETADNRARADLQKTFKVFVSGLSKDYSSTEGQLVERAIRTYQNGALSGVVIQDRYLRNDGSYFALAKLDLENFKAFLAAAPGLDADLRESLREKSEALFAELAKEGGDKR